MVIEFREKIFANNHMHSERKKHHSFLALFFLPVICGVRLGDFGHLSEASSHLANVPIPLIMCCSPTNDQRQLNLR